MGFWHWLRSHFGTNGFDAEEHEQEVQDLKDSTDDRLSEAGRNLDDIGTTFKKVEESFAPDEFPVRPAGPRKEGPALCNEG